MTTIDTKHLRVLAEAATPGGRTPAGSLIVADGGATVGQAFGINWRNDQAYLAAIDPPTLIALLDRLEELEGREPEWEYNIAYPRINANAERVWKTDGLESSGREEIEDEFWSRRDSYLENDRIVRRRKAGPWEPVEGETGE